MKAQPDWEYLAYLDYSCGQQQEHIESLKGRLLKLSWDDPRWTTIANILDDNNEAQPHCPLENALEEIQVLIESMPSGIDYEAKPDDSSPEDMASHIGGLIWQICERVK